MVSMEKTENKKTKVKGNTAKREKKQRRTFFTISKKILSLSLLPMIIVCALVATVGSRALEAGIEKQIEKALQIVGVSVDETYTNLYEGDYTKDKGGKVRKGGTSISGGDAADRRIAGEDGIPGVFPVREYASDHNADETGGRSYQRYRFGDGDLRADPEGRTAVP